MGHPRQPTDEDRRPDGAKGIEHDTDERREHQGRNESVHGVVERHGANRQVAVLDLLADADEEGEVREDEGADGRSREDDSVNGMTAPVAMLDDLEPGVCGEEDPRREPADAGRDGEGW
jgi:hypothetical protein